MTSHSFSGIVSALRSSVLEARVALDAGNERESGIAKVRPDSFACPIACELGASPAFDWFRIVADNRALIRWSVKTQKPSQARNALKSKASPRVPVWSNDLLGSLSSSNGPLQAAENDIG
jgi:hypothetical protein